MKKKIVPLFICLLFAIPFSFGGIFFGIAGIASTSYQWFQTRNWQAVEAHVISAELKSQSHSEGGVTYRVVANYRYQFNGAEHIGKRIGLDSMGFDSVSDWHQQHYARLNAAKNNDTPISIWVNPQKPEQSVVDRDIRWQIMLFRLPFAILFTLVGLAAFVMAWRIIRNRDLDVALGNKNDVPDGKTWWQAEKMWRKGHIASETKLGVFGAWLVSLVWGSIAFTVPAVFIVKDAVPLLVKLLLLLLPLIGLWMIWRAILATIEWRRYGELKLVLTPFPALLNHKMSARIDLPGHKLSGAVYDIDLICQNVDDRGDESTKRNLWQKSLRAQANTNSGQTRLEFSFDVPENFPPSEPTDPVYHRWEVHVRCDQAGAKLDQHFTIPVLKQTSATPASATPSLPLAATSFSSQPLPNFDSVTIPPQTATIENRADGLHITYPASRNRGIGTLLLIFGMVFLGATIFMGSHVLESDFMLPFTLLFFLVFLAVSLAMVVGGIYLLINTLTVTIGRGRATARRQAAFYGKTETMPIRSDNKLIPYVTSKTNQGATEKIYYGIKLVGGDNIMLTVADGILGAAQTQALLRKLVTACELSERQILPIETAETNQLHFPKQNAYPIRKGLKWLELAFGITFLLSLLLMFKDVIFR